MFKKSIATNTDRIICWYITDKLKPEQPKYPYELSRFMEEADKRGNIDIRIIPQNSDIQLIASHNKDEHKILINNKEAESPDCIISRTGAGTITKHFDLIDHLKKVETFIINSSRGIFSAQNKFKTLQYLINSKTEIPVAKTLKINNKDFLIYPIQKWVKYAEKYIGFPVILKTATGSKGGGVKKADNIKELTDELSFLRSADIRNSLLLQEYIKLSSGRDLRVFVVGNEVIACMERKAGPQGDFRANYSQGGSVKEFDLPPQAVQLAIKCAKILGLKIAGVDLFIEGERFRVCEVNSSPGFKGLEEACAVDVPKAVFDYLFKKFNKTKK